MLCSTIIGVCVGFVFVQGEDLRDTHELYCHLFCWTVLIGFSFVLIRLKARAIVLFASALIACALIVLIGYLYWQRVGTRQPLCDMTSQWAATSLLLLPIGVKSAFSWLNIGPR